MNTAVTNKGVRRSIKLRAPVFVLPAFVCFLISFAVPFVHGLYLSFCKFNIPRDAHWIGLSNYVTAFADPGFRTALGNSLLFMLASVICINVPAFFIGYLLSEKFRGVAAIEKHHEERYRALLKNVEMQQVFEKSEVKIWECRNCGHIVVGTKAPEVCPVCNHPQAYFEVAAENY